MNGRHGGRWAGATLLLAALLVAGCDNTPADSGAVAQGNEPEGTISDDLPDLDLLPNDAPLADPEDQGLEPGASPTAPSADDAAAPEAQEAATPAPSSSPAPAPSPPAQEDEMPAE